MDAVALDEVWMVPAGTPYMKAGQEILPGEERLRMTRLAIRDNDRFRCLDIEVKRQGYTYTFETLEWLRGRYPEDEFFFIVGADCLFAIEGWKAPERIFANCTLVAATRGRIPCRRWRRRSGNWRKSIPKRLYCSPSSVCPFPLRRSESASAGSRVSGTWCLTMY